KDLRIRRKLMPKSYNRESSMLFLGLMVRRAYELNSTVRICCAPAPAGHYRPCECIGGSSFFNPRTGELTIRGDKPFRYNSPSFVSEVANTTKPIRQIVARWLAIYNR